ncbi:DUF397 domain-containing protein [Streptomyces sp. NPDC050481]|uniref:DUF397 domain-containing protein n=1 Tax=Streptomyces sp. NPDC050481 TaxID=3365616 RepID=UPI003789BE54
MIRKASAGTPSELKWFKSSYSSGPDGDSCVEIATASHAVQVRDSKNDTTGPPPHLCLNYLDRVHLTGVGRET